MPLNKAALQSDLLDLFESPPDSAEGCAAAWGDAVESHATDVFPESSTVTAAANVLAATLANLFVTETPVSNAASFAAKMETAFLTYATAVGAGMSPAYTATPPAGSVGFYSLFLTARGTAEEAASDFADAIHAWMLTGTATQTTSPFSTVNWV